MHWTIQKKILVGFGLSWLAMVIVGTVTYLSTVNLQGYINQAQQAQHVQDSLDNLLVDLVDAETGQRGFVITGEDEFLEPYTAALPRIEERLQTLRTYTADNDPHTLAHQAHLDTLEGLVAQRLELLATAIQIRRTQGYDAAQAVIAAGEGKAIMDEIRLLLAEMEEDETIHLTQKAAQVQASVQFVVVFIGFGTLLVLGVAVAGGISLANRVDESTNALVVGVGEIAAGNLDYKVPVTSHDEIAILTDAFNQMAGRLQTTQAELTESHTFFQSLFESSPEAILVVNRQGNIEMANAQTEQVFGYPPVELQGMAIENLIPERFREQHQQHRAQYMEHPYTRLVGTGLELFGRHRSGTELPVDVVLSPLQKPEANLVLALVRDITKRKQAEDALRQAHDELEQRVQERTAELARSEKEFRALADNALVGVYRSTPAGELLYANEALAHMLGYARVAVLMEKGVVSHYRNPADRSVLIEQLRKKGSVTNYEAELLTKDGETRTALISGSLEAEIISGMQIDVTERKRAEEEIRRLNADLEQRVEERTAQLAQANLDLQAEIAEREQLEIQIRQNEARAQALADLSQTLAEARLDQQPLFEMIARRVSELLGDGCNLSLISRDEKWLGNIALYHPDEEALALMKSLIDVSPHPVGQGLAGQVAKTGKPILIPIVPPEQTLQQIKPEFLPYVDRYGIASVLIVPMRARDRVIGTLGVSRDRPGRPYTPEDQSFLQDIADRAGLAFENARLFVEAMEAREDADQANLAKSEFLSRMSHELRTPLNAILGFAQILGMDELNQRQKNSIHHILRAGKHLLALINEVLDITRIEVGKLSLSPEAIRVKDVVEETIELVEVQASRRNIQIETSSLFSGYVKADRQRLKQVLLNLLSNAIKYNREEGSVMVDCVVLPEERLRVRVSDTGPGIPPEKQKKLFLPFERLGAEQSNVEGTGLGLSLSHRLVQAIGGKMGIESEPGAGSTFWIELPIVNSPIEESYHPEDGIILFKPGSDPTRTHSVLCFEDNISNMQLIEQIFKHRPSVNLMAATDGKTGLKASHEKDPELILLDLNLPDLTGYEVLHQLKADPQTRKIPVIVISADATPGQIQRLLDAGAHKYLTKPLDVGQFLQVVDEILEESA